eukprot:CAMPEP_0180530182 /NCGR_PEP_ID=MMETSP1036_2-20121128/61779_1 /TAXON_ID=632150 /ORGANISM="Azadinium spinosum, Strain 3D9" /LENGTH=33 /DNA_ID= /DNA_START= /DNA_END= /DNA_ORIENTATION=
MKARLRRLAAGDMRRLREVHEDVLDSACLHMSW